MGAITAPTYKAATTGIKNSLQFSLQIDTMEFCPHPNLRKLIAKEHVFVKKSL